MGVLVAVPTSSSLVDPFAGAGKALEDRRIDDVAALQFPAVFSLLCFAAFLVPIWTVFHLSQDPHVRYWMGEKLLRSVALLPVVYVLVHIVHCLRGKPVRFAIITTLFGSCVVLLVASNAVMMESMRLGTSLASEDCSSSDEKTRLNAQWRQARDFLDTCAKTLAAQRGVAGEAATALVRLPDCEGYDLAAAEPSRGGSWDYLQMLEEHDHCAGWCQEQPALWTSSATKDACSRVVAQVMAKKLARTSTQVLVYSVAAFGIFAAALIVGVPLLSKNGVAW